MKSFCLALLLLTYSFAADSSSNSSRSNVTPTVIDDFSNLNTVEEFQKQAVVIITTFLNAINEVPNPTLCGDEDVLEEITLAARFARKAKIFFTEKSEYHQKLCSVYKSTRENREILTVRIFEEKSLEFKEKIENENDKKKLNIYDTYVPLRNQAVKDTLEALQSVSLTKSSFEWLMKFSYLVTEFAVKFRLLSNEYLVHSIRTNKALQNRAYELNFMITRPFKD